jgi:hypothetical protein
MLCHDWQAVAPAIAAVRQAHEAGRFDAAEWRAALERIQRACALAESPGLDSPLEILGCDEFRALAAAIRSRLQY